MLYASERIQRKGSVAQGTSVGDASEEARARGLSTELNVARFDYLGDQYVVLDCPGSIDFASEADTVLPAVDLTIVVADPDPGRANLLQPLLRSCPRTWCRSLARGGARTARVSARRPLRWVVIGNRR